MNIETILMIEDNEVMQQLMTYVLVGEGYKVIPVSDSQEALRVFLDRAEEISLVLSNRRTGVFDTRNLVLNMSAIKPSVRIITVSGYLDPAFKQEMESIGVTDFVAKSFKADEIIQKVDEVIHNDLTGY